MLVRLANALLRRAYWIVLSVICAVGIVLALSGWAEPVENRLSAWRDAIAPRPASGEIIIVEIDARSLVEVQDWPWPRSIHGRLVDQLREAGARQIVFDIDFTSTASDPEQDRAFGAAIARAAGRVVLPGFLENASGQFGERVEALPAPMLRSGSRIGSIWFELDDDFSARRAPYSVEIVGAQRPSLSTVLADRASERSGFFPIDWSHDWQSFPTISYADVLAGRFDPSFFRNRKVLIGATATTFGDRFTVPNHGRIPAVVIHATAAETLRRGHPIMVGPWPAVLLVAGLLAIATASRRKPLRIAGWLGIGTAILVVPFVLDRTTLLVVETAPALIAYSIGLLASGALGMAANVASRLTLTPGTLLPNLVAMTMSSPRGASTVAVRVRNYLETGALLGPQAQAELLRKVCARLSLAAGDSPIFQVDAHSFAWRTTRSVEDIVETIDGLNALFGGGIKIGDQLIDVMISVGICADHKLDVETSVSAALLASDRAARRGINWGRYEPDDDDEKWRISLVAELDRAMREGELWVAYQPQFQLASGAIRGAEALVRWTHPRHGDIRPELFIPILEEHEQIEKLTLHVLRAAILDFSALDESLSVSVNISMKLIGRNRLLEPIRSMLHEFRLDARRLTLEITESAALSDASHIEELRELRRLGVNISIDDYGTGQSTLTYLKTLPATELKIDRTFVQLIVSSRSDATMVDSTIKLAHALGLTVVAEGVESEEVAAKLQAMECDLVQGFHTGRPGTIEQFNAYAQAPAASAATSRKVAARAPARIGRK